jgi:hypothetical protein
LVKQSPAKSGTGGCFVSIPLTKNRGKLQEMQTVGNKNRE